MSGLRILVWSFEPAGPTAENLTFNVTMSISVNTGVATHQSTEAC